MTNVLIADRYAKALSEAIADDADLDSNLDALDVLSEMLSQSAQLHRVLNDPSRRVKERAAVLDAILQRVSAPTPAHNAAVVMLRRGRFALLPLMAQMFRRRVDERCNRVAATVTTAIPLTDDQAAPLILGLEDYIGRDVRLDRRVDDAILGGVVAEIAGIIIDGSVRSRLDRIGRELTENDENLLN